MNGSPLAVRYPSLLTWAASALPASPGSGGHIGEESLRRWVVQAEIDRGRRAGTTSEEARRISELERENRELRRANEILKAASTFFAAELDRPASR